MKKLYLIFAIFIGTILIGCTSENPEVPSTPEKEENKPVEKVDYYIKYVAESPSRYYSINGVTVNTDKGTVTIDMSGKKSWEQTFGPVPKGFKANISVKGTTGSLEIYCCRGQEKFALKAMLNGEKKNPSLSYTIDY